MKLWPLPLLSTVNEKGDYYQFHMFIAWPSWNCRYFAALTSQGVNVRINIRLLDFIGQVTSGNNLLSSLHSDLPQPHTLSNCDCIKSHTGRHTICKWLLAINHKIHFFDGIISAHKFSPDEGIIKLSEDVGRPLGGGQWPSSMGGLKN